MKPLVAYDIDTAAAMDAVRKTEAELAVLASVPAELQRSVDTVETALGSSRVARAFTAFGAGELLPDLRSILSRAEDAVQGVTQAVAEYLRADQEMRARAEAAAAAVPDASGRSVESAPPPSALPIVPSAPPVPLPKSEGPDAGPARQQPVPIPKTLPPPQEPAPEPDPEPEPETPAPLPGPEWIFRPALPGRPPIIVARDLMLRHYHPCPGGWFPHPGCFRPGWRGPAYPPGWLRPGWPGPVWPGPAYPPGGWHPVWPGPALPGPAYPPGGWIPRWPEPGLPPRGRFPWLPARPLPKLFPNPGIIPLPGRVDAWPLEIKRLPLVAAIDGSQGVSGASSSGKWGLT